VGVLTTLSNEILIRTMISHESDSGCEIAYTQLKLGGELWYSIGLEWFGNDAIHLDTTSIPEFFGETTLGIRQSRRYAHFLTQLLHGQRNELFPIDYYSSQQKYVVQGKR